MTEHEDDEDGPSMVSSSITSSSKMDDTFMRETLNGLHKLCMSQAENVRLPAISSLETISEIHPLMVLQTWLDQFGRTNGGSAPSEYAAPDRVNLLKTLQILFETNKLIFDDKNSAHRAVIGRVIALTTEEMTRHSEIIPDVQKPCSAILIKIGSDANIERVMDVLMTKFNNQQQQSNIQPHYYVISTLGSLASVNSIKSVPYIKGILETMINYMKSKVKDNMRYGYANCISRFSDAVLDYLAIIDDTPDPSLNKEQFVQLFDQVHEILFNNWLNGGSIRDVKLRVSILEALATTPRLLSDDRLYKNTTTILNSFIGLYKKIPSDTFYITQCISQTLNAVVSLDTQILQSIIEPLLTSLFNQVCQNSNCDYSKPLQIRNNHESLRCYDVLIQSHGDKLISGLLVRYNSVDENVRVASLIIIKHLLNSSLDHIQDRINDVIAAIHGKLNDPSLKVRKMLAQLTALLGNLGYLHGSRGKEFLEFIVRQCSITDSNSECDAKELRTMCDSILMLLTKSKEVMDTILWPNLLQYLLLPNFADSVPSIIKSLTVIVVNKRKNNSPDFMIDYGSLPNIPGPYALLARLVVCAALPFKGSTRGTHILTFLQNFSPNVNRHLTVLWDKRIPLLQHYLDTHTNSSSSSLWDQRQWEEWLLALVEDTVAEIDLEEWSTALSGAMIQQLNAFYSNGSDTSAEKCFLIRCLGHVLKRTMSRQVVIDNLNTIFIACNYANESESLATAEAFGTTSVRHLDLVLEKLENLCKLDFLKGKGSGNFLFGLLRDTKSEDENQLKARRTILGCIGQSSIKTSSENITKKADIIIMKFIMPGLKHSNVDLKSSALEALTHVSKSVQKEKYELAHHTDLIHEAIISVQCDIREFPNKSIALAATLELVRLPPFISQMTRCTLLKACFNSVFPVLLKQDTISKNHNECDNEGLIKGIVDILKNIVTELMTQELEQSTLDELFTMIEDYLKREFDLSRELAVGLLECALDTFSENVSVDEVQLSFNPGPYILGSLIPRCFDPSAQVKSVALKCLSTLMKIFSLYEGRRHGTENDFISLDLVSPSKDISKTIVDVLSKRINHDQLLPLFLSLLDHLLDKKSSSSRGTSLVLCSLMESRGSELYNKAPELMIIIHEKLIDITCDDTKNRVLKCVRILTNTNPRGVINTLLKISPWTNSDTGIRSIWKTLPEDNNLSKSVMNHLLEVVKCTSNLITVESPDRITGKTGKIANREPLAAIFALGLMFQSKGMEEVVLEEFSDVFVPLLTAMGTYIGITNVEKISKYPTSSLSTSKKSTSSLTSNSVPSKIPYLEASHALQTFLTCKGCFSLSIIIASNHGNKNEMDIDMNYSTFFNLISKIIEIMLSDTPRYVPKLLTAYESSLSHENMGNRLTANAFYASCLKHEEIIDPSTYDEALENLLKSQNSETSKEIKIVLIRGFSDYKMSFEKHNQSVLNYLINGIDDDDSSVCFNSLNALRNVIYNYKLNVQEPIPLHTLSTLGLKVRPFFDSGGHRLSGAAIQLFARLIFFSGHHSEYKNLIYDQIHGVFVSLLIHYNDDDLGVKEASTEALSEIIKALGMEGNNNQDDEDFIKNLTKSLGRYPSFTPMYPIFITTCLGYFASPISSIRYNAVILVYNLILGNDHQNDISDIAEKICRSFLTLFNDPDEKVRIIASQTLGSVYVQLFKG